MKTVGKQLQEARLAKNWTPELAARETKIKVDRLRDLESDDYSHFTSPTYARGFVRTYARALGLDEYRILRQLDNKLPDDDSANIVTDSGVAYLPETALPPRAAHRDYTGLYVVVALGGVVALISTFVLFEAYRVGELSRWFASSSDNITSAAAANTNSAGLASITSAEAPARALPVDSNTPPPIADTTAATNAPPAVAPVATVATDTTTAPRALPVDPSLLGAGVATNSAPVADAPITAPRAMPVDPSELTNAPAAIPAPAPATASDAPVVAPRALPVDPSELTNAASGAPAATNTTPTVANPSDTSTVALNNIPQPSPSPVAPPAVPPAPVVPPPDPAPEVMPTTPAPSPSARQPNSGPVIEPSLPAVSPSPDTAPAAPLAPTAPVAPVALPVTDPATTAPPQPAASTDAANDSSGDKPLVLTASQDSFVRVTDLDSPDADKPLYAAVLHSGESIAFNGHKFSINVGVPSAVDIKLDGVNYGPHSDQEAPETFTVQSHLP